MMKRLVTELQKMALPLCGVVLASSFIVGCGDKESNPDAITVDKLKGPGKLKISDEGNGNITLSWTGSNNEDDFDGYNIYGVKTKSPGEPAKVGDLTEGNALQLLDDEGEPIEAAKTTLASFNYNPENGLGLAAPMPSPFSLTATSTKTSTSTSTTASEKPDFEALPIHTLNEKERLLPTCKHDGNGNCVQTTKENEGETVEDNNSIYAVNGQISYKRKGLKVGDTYCFLVLSTFDRGKKVSQSSSNLACVTPKYAVDVAIEVPTEKDPNTFLKLDFNTWIDQCNAAANGQCPQPTSLFTKDLPSNKSYHRPGEKGPIYIEMDDNNNLVWVAGKNHAIADLGYYKSGFDDPSLPRKAPELALDSDEANASDENIKAPIINEGGYSIAGQSIAMAAGHVYVFAISAKDAEAPTSFHYIWAYVNPTTSSQVSFRIPKDQE